MKNKDIYSDVKLIKNKLNMELIEVLANEKEGTKEEQQKLQKIITELGDNIYIDAVYLLTHESLENTYEAKEVFEDIKNHRDSMSQLLNRVVTIQVAALDYIQNIRKIIKHPTIIDSDKYYQFVYNAFIDETTKTYDKKLLDSDLESEIEKALRWNLIFSIAFIDIDNLKDINDSYGHLIGTKVVRFISHCIKKYLRKYDTIYRYGGDEFVILLPKTDILEAKQILQRINAYIGHKKFEELPQKPSVSVGIATFDMKLIKNKENLLHAADSALYYAKRTGKNKICLHTEIKGLSSIMEADISQQKKNIQKNKRIVIKGIPLVPGLGSGHVFYYKDIKSLDTEIRYLKESETESEIRRIRKAIKQVKNELLKMKKNIEKEIGIETAKIFDVHYTILSDKFLLDEIETEIKEKMINAEQVIKNIFYRLENKFKASKSLIIQEKSLDIHDIGKRIINFLVGREGNILLDIPERSVIFTKCLLPSDITHIKNKLPVAIITEEGGAYSHSALIAKTLGIPLVLIKDFNKYNITKGTEVLVDGTKGFLIINPDEKEKKDFASNISLADRQFDDLAKDIQGKLLVKDNSKIKIMANVSSTEDIQMLMKYDCDGIGLLRMESIYLESLFAPTEKQLYNQIYNLLEPFKDKEITLRLADFGGDKIIPYLKMDKKETSSLGLRGIRFLLQHIDLLKTQLRVCIRLSRDFDIKILVPFVTVTEDIKSVRNYLENEKKELKNIDEIYKEDIKLGAMIETPSSVINLDEILTCSDFIAIGSNDLLQYIMVADREIQKVSGYYVKGHNLVLDAIKTIIKKCDNKGISCCLCGELAYDKRFTNTLLDYGLKEFSVFPLFIPEIKSHIFHILNQ